MLLIEADGKALLRGVGIATPDGVVISQAEALPTLPGSGPWMVKAQVPVGGRGKAGGVVHCRSDAEVRAALRRLLGARIKGHVTRTCLVETAVDGAEYYLSMMIDPAHYAVRVTLLREGGINVEQAADTKSRSRLAAPDIAAIEVAVGALVQEGPARAQASLIDAGRKLAQLFIQRELMLAEINPLFVNDSGCVAGDAKIVVDLDAVHRQPEIGRLIEANAATYPDAIRKLCDGFDYVEVDPGGEIGLITTGAGLSMMLIDELTARGLRPINFLDIRTGMLRGDPTRLIKALAWIAARPSARVVLVNIFAGITDLGEFAGLLCTALERTPALKTPVVARLVGNGFEAARQYLAAQRPDIKVEESLDKALAHVDAVLASGAR